MRRRCVAMSKHGNSCLIAASSRIPELLAFVARDRGQWDRSDSYVNEAERLDPRNVRPAPMSANAPMRIDGTIVVPAPVTTSAAEDRHARITSQFSMEAVAFNKTPAEP